MMTSLQQTSDVLTAQRYHGSTSHARPFFKLVHYQRQNEVDGQVSITLHTGRIVDATVRAIIERTDGKRLQVDYGKDETALVALWRVHPK